MHVGQGLRTVIVLESPGTGVQTWCPQLWMVVKWLDIRDGVGKQEGVGVAIYVEFD